MRTLSVIFFTIRLLLLSIFVYNISKLLPAEKRSSWRQRTTLKTARRIADFFIEKGGIFIKASQFLATVSNLFDSEFTEIFAKVPDRVKPYEFDKVRYRFLREFGTEPEELYTEFDRTPLVAASLGQVHTARIPDGRKVAVKFLHPGIEQKIRSDLRSLSYAINMILFFYPYLDFRSHLSEFRTMLLSETDYQNEAENMRRAADNFRYDERIIIPEVISEFSGLTVLTTEFIEGIQLSDMERIDTENIDRKELTTLLLETYARMVFEDRFYHADPHPGNLFVIPGDSLRPLRLGLVDFGAVQSVSERMMSLMGQVFETVQRRDFLSLADLGIEYGLLSDHLDREVYSNIFELMEARYGSFKIDDYYRINPVRFGRMIKMRDLSAVGLRLRDVLTAIKLPRSYIYLGRTLTMLLSLSIQLDEKTNVFMIARPHVEKYLMSRPGGLRWYMQGRNLRSAMRRLLSPYSSQKIARAITNQVNREEARKLNAKTAFRIARQSIYTFLFASGSFLSAWLYVHNEHTLVYFTLGFTGICFLAMMRSLRRYREKPDYKQHP